MVPDYLIYDEIKHRRQREKSQERELLEFPLYRPPVPRPYADRGEDDAPAEERGVAIIDMNDWLDEDE
ncbi:MAG: hypothetical protein AAGI01_10295 [Myxococcota bacterium]